MALTYTILSRDILSKKMAMKGQLKYAYFQCIISILCLMMLFSTRLTAQNINIKKGENNFKVKANTYKKLNFSSSLCKLNVKDIVTTNGKFSELRIANYGYSNNIGSPKLPVQRKLIEIPLNAKVLTRVTNQHYQNFTLKELGIKNQLMPGQPHVSKDTTKQAPDFKLNTDIYAKNEYIKADTNIVTVKYLGIMRGVNLAILNISPVEYNPSSKSLKVYDNLDVEVTFEKGDIGKTIQMKKTTNSSVYSNALKNIVNYKPSEEKSNISFQAPVKYVVVSDPMFKETLKPFLQWKRRSGFNVIDVYTDNPDVGKTKESIRTYLKNLYNNSTKEDPAPSFILLVGDVTQIPAFLGTSSPNVYVTDLPYCEYTGDFLPEVFIGRFTANNTDELLSQLNKTLEYEQFTMPDPSYLNNAILIAGVDARYARLYANGQMSYVFNNYLNSENGFNTFLTEYPNSATQAQNIKQKINEGAGIIYYSAHGSWDGWVNPSIRSSDVASFQNKDKYSLMIGNACYSQAFNQATCFGKAVMKAANKGAIGYIGASSESYWDEDFWWSTGFCNIDTIVPYGGNKTLGAFDRMFHTHGEKYSDWGITLGEFLNNGNLSVTQSGSPDYTYYWEIYNLLGDPSLIPFLGQPDKLKIKYDTLIDINTKSINISTEPYTYLAFSVKDSLIGVSYADSNGISNFDIPLSAANIQFSAIHQNKIPYYGNIRFYNSDTVKTASKISGASSITLKNIKKPSLNGRVENKNIVLNWIPEPDKDAENFIIEKSSDGQNFINIGRVDIIKSSNSDLEYSFIDENPNKDINYYRLKLTDQNGNSRYLSNEPTQVKYEGKLEMKIWPNPSDGENINLFIKKK